MGCLPPFALEDAPVAEGFNSDGVIVGCANGVTFVDGEGSFRGDTLTPAGDSPVREGFAVFPPAKLGEEPCSSEPPSDASVGLADGFEMEGEMLAAGSSEPVEPLRGSSIGLGDAFNAKDTSVGEDVSLEDEIGDTVGVDVAGPVSNCRVTERKYLVFAGGTRRVSNKTEKVSRRRHDNGG